MAHPLVYVAPDADALFDACFARLQRLLSEGFDVCVAAPDSPGLDAFRASGFRTRPLPGGGSWNVAGWIGAYLILQAEFIENPPTLVHSFGVPWAWIGSFAANRADVAAIVATVATHDLERPNHRLGQLLARMPEALLDRTPDGTSAYRTLGRWLDAYFVYHEDDMRQLIDQGAVPGEKLELILGGAGVDLETYNDRDDDLPTAEEARTQLDVPGKVRTLIAASGPWTDEALSTVRELQRRMARTHPGVGWLIVGDGPPGTKASVTSPVVLRAADVWLHVDAKDGEGADLMRAAAMATPVVAINSAAARSILVDYETGRICAPDFLFETLVETLGDPKRLRDMGIRARARATERFDRRHIDEQVLRIYDRLLTKRVRT